MPLTRPDFGIAKTIQGGMQHSATPGVGSKPVSKAPPPSATQPKPTPLTSQVMAQPQQQQPQGYQELLGLFNSLLPMAGPGIASSNAQIGNFQNTLGNLFAGQEHQGNLLNQQMQNQLAGVNLSGEGLDLQRAILARQQGLAPQQNALQNQLYGLNQEAINANRGELGQLNALSNKELGLGYQDLAASRSSLMDNYQNQKQNLSGQLASQGAVVSPGASRGYQNLENQLSSSLGSIDRQSQQLGITGERQGIGYQSSLGNVDRASRQQEINKKQYDLNYGEEQARLADQSKNLDLVAKQHGLSREDIQNRTDQALAQLGLSTMLTSGDIYTSIINAQNGKFDAITPILGAIYQYIGLRPMAGK